MKRHFQHGVLLAFVVFTCRLEALAQEAESPGPGEAREVEPRHTLRVFEGQVFSAQGAPAEGALVVTSVGGAARADARGFFRLEVLVPLDVETIEITARAKDASAKVVRATSSHGAIAVGALVLEASSVCAPSWLPTFGGHPGTDGPVLCSAVLDDGSGEALYLGGSFRSAGGILADGLARWDGASWSALGTNLYPSCLAVFDDGNGPALYVGGDFVTIDGLTVNRIARWDGSNWSALGSGVGGKVTAVQVFDDGNGAALYVGGLFTTAGGLPAQRIAKWDGQSWSALGSGLNDMVHALAVHDDGTGDALYVGGAFTLAGGISANAIARWNGQSWSALASGANNRVRDLQVFDDGSGPALYAGGDFFVAGGLPAQCVARWDGQAWSALGAGVGQSVWALTLHDDGGGPALHAGGSLGVDGIVARWDGQGWQDLGDPSFFVTTMSSFQGVLTCGGFYQSGGEFTGYLAQRVGSAWVPVGTGLNGTVHALEASNEGGLYVGGGFNSAGLTEKEFLAKWDGTSFAPLGNGPTVGQVYALEAHDDGSGEVLYAGGTFTSIGGVAALRVARWDGAAWAPLGSGLSDTVEDLGVFDLGAGPVLVAAGWFRLVGSGVGIGTWNGATWNRIGGGGVNHPTLDPRVYELIQFDDGSGDALYIGGTFTSVGDKSARNIARWNGSSWSDVGGGMSAGVLDMAVFDDGTGAKLYAAGAFGGAGGTPASRIARWDGVSWTPVGPGLDNLVHALVVHDDGSGAALYAGGYFGTAGGVAANRIAKWNGQTWSALGGGVLGFSNSLVRPVLELAVFDDGGGAALYAGGSFTVVPDSGDSFLAKWGCYDTVAPELACPAAVEVFDERANGPGEVVNFTVHAEDGKDPAPLVVCTPPSGSFFPPGSTLVTCTATDASGNQSTCQFPVIVRRKVRLR